MQETTTTEKPRLLDCPGCASPLPLRLPNAGQVANSWECNYCHERFHAVFVDSAPPNRLDNARPCWDLDPRITMNGQTLAQMHKRDDRPGRVFDERQSDRHPKELALSIKWGDFEVHAESVDISTGGFGFISDAPILSGTVITAVFESVPGQPVCEAVVRSCRELPGCSFRVGVSFKSTS